MDEYVNQFDSYQMVLERKKAISEAEAKPETRSNIPAKIIATTADAVGEFTVKPLRKTANWHK